MELTVRLDPDVEEIVRNAATALGEDFDRVLNDFVRKGRLRAASWPTCDLRVRPGIEMTKALAFADEFDDEETLRELREYERR